MAAIAEWREFLGCFDDYGDENCVISGLAILDKQGKLLYTSGWLKDKEKRWNSMDFVNAIHDAQTLTIGEAKFYPSLY